MAKFTVGTETEGELSFRLGSAHQTVPPGKPFPSEPHFLHLKNGHEDYVRCQLPGSRERRLGSLYWEDGRS